MREYMVHSRYIWVKKIGRLRGSRTRGAAEVGASGEVFHGFLGGAGVEDGVGVGGGFGNVGGEEGVGAGDVDGGGVGRGEAVGGDYDVDFRVSCWRRWRIGGRW